MRFRVLLPSLVSVLILPLHAEVAGFTKVKELKGITEYRLDANGLTVLLLPEHSAPAVTFMVTYRIGSRNESYGTTGATHLLEHLMFKGTAKFNKEAGTGYDQMLESTGAEVNATTWLDRTNYFATLGSQDLPVAIELEADRMRNLRLREEDRRPEMTVVRNEYERSENDPASALLTEVWGTAYLAHPYHHSVIGWRSDFENVPIEKLRAFYDTYYWPDNATVSVIGDFKTDAALKLIKQHYAAIPKAPQPIPQVYTEEPPQTGPRRVVMKRPGELGVVSVAYKSPRARDADYPALKVLCDILSNGRNSRFHLALTDAGMTTGVEAYPEFTLDASLLHISAEITPGSTHEKVEKKIHEVVAKVRDKGVSEGETRDAISRLTAQSAYQRDGSFLMASVLNECIAVGDWTLYLTEEDALRKVTAEDVLKVAKRWLVEDQTTTGWYVPETDQPVAEEKDEPATAETLAAPAPASQPIHAPLILPEIKPSPAVEVAKIAPRVVRTRSGGLDLLVCPTGVEDVVTLTGSLPFGDSSQQTLAAFSAGMLKRGTTKQSASALAAKLDEVGATLDFATTEGSLEFSARCLKKDLPLVISLLAEQLRTPSFPADEIKKLRTQLIAAVTQSRADTNAQAGIAFNRAAFPAGHPNWKPTSEDTLKALAAVKREDLLAFQKQWLGPAGAVLVAAGDVDPVACQTEVAKAFAGWSGGQLPKAVAAAPSLEKEVDAKVAIPGKESVTLLLGQPSGLSFRDPDTLPLLLATEALGKGFTSRLLSTVRDSEGLTYGVNAGMTGDTANDGSWLIFATFAPSLLDRGVTSIRRELDKWHRDGLTPGEFAYRQSALIGSHRVKLATTEGLSATLLATIRAGLPVSWIDDYPAQISAVTLEQVNAVIRRRLDPAKMIVVKSGGAP